jgi:hypothetical protein
MGDTKRGSMSKVYMHANAQAKGYWVPHCGRQYKAQPLLTAKLRNK